MGATTGTIISWINGLRWLIFTIGVALASALACGGPPAVKEEEVCVLHETTALEDMPTRASSLEPSLYAASPPVGAGALARLGRGSVHSIALSPDGDYLAVPSGAGLHLYTLDPFEQVWLESEDLLIGETAVSIF